MSRLFYSLALSSILGAPLHADEEEDFIRPEKEQRAIEKIQRNRMCHVYCNEDVPGQPIYEADFSNATDELLQLLVEFPLLRKLELFGGTIADDGLIVLKQIPRLKVLHIRNMFLSESNIASIISCDQLVHLSFYHCQMDELGFKHMIALQKLEDLSFSDCAVPEEFLIRLEKLTSLREVSLIDTQTSEVGISRLKFALPYAMISHYQTKQNREWLTTENEVLLGLTIITLLTIALAVGLRMSPAVRRRQRLWTSILVLLGIGWVGYELHHLEPKMSPIQDGDPGTFWVRACGIDVGARDVSTGWSGYYAPRDGWFIYYTQGMHGQRLHRVPSADAIALFPALVAKLERAPPGVLQPDVERGYREWVRTTVDRNDAVGLLAKIDAERARRVRAESEERFEYLQFVEEDFAARWLRFKRYPWNVRLEFAFLSALIVFTAWPWMRGAGRFQSAIHFSVAPFCFFLPFWLGYAQWTMTSAGQSGGVLYPWLLEVASSPLRGWSWTSLDTLLLKNTPPILEPFSQTLGPMLSISSFGAVGPVAMATVSLLFFISLMWGKWIFSKVRISIEGRGVRCTGRRGPKVFFCKVRISIGWTIRAASKLD